jgi:hypothetical protein
VLDVEHGGKIDVFVARLQDAFTTSRLERRLRAQVFDVPCWVASAEDVVLAKLRWRLGSRSEVQWRDCVEIASTNDSMPTTCGAGPRGSASPRTSTILTATGYDDHD